MQRPAPRKCSSKMHLAGRRDDGPPPSTACLRDHPAPVPLPALAARSAWQLAALGCRVGCWPCRSPLARPAASAMANVRTLRNGARAQHHMILPLFSGAALASSPWQPLSAAAPAADPGSRAAAKLPKTRPLRSSRKSACCAALAKSARWHRTARRIQRAGAGKCVDVPLAYPEAPFRTVDHLNDGGSVDAEFPAHHRWWHRASLLNQELSSHAYSELLHGSKRRRPQADRPPGQWRDPRLLVRGPWRLCKRLGSLAPWPRHRWRPWPRH